MPRVLTKWEAACTMEEENGLCGSFGCTLPNKHSGLCQIPDVAPRERKSKAKLDDDWVAPPKYGRRGPKKPPNPGVCDRNPLCVRGFKHMGHGGHCLLSNSKMTADRERQAIQAPVPWDGSSPRPCDHDALCIRGYRHAGKGGRCKYAIVIPDFGAPCDRDRLCIRGFRHGGHGGHCKYATEVKTAIALAEALLLPSGDEESDDGDEADFLSSDLLAVPVAGGGMMMLPNPMTKLKAKGPTKPVAKKPRRDEGAALLSIDDELEPGERPPSASESVPVGAQLSDSPCDDEGASHSRVGPQYQVDSLPEYEDPVLASENLTGSFEWIETLNQRGDSVCAPRCAHYLESDGIPNGGDAGDGGGDEGWRRGFRRGDGGGHLMATERNLAIGTAEKLTAAAYDDTAPADLEPASTPAGFPCDEESCFVTAPTDGEIARLCARCDLEEGGSIAPFDGPVRLLEAFEARPLSAQPIGHDLYVDATWENARGVARCAASFANQSSEPNATVAPRSIHGHVVGESGFAALGTQMWLVAMERIAPGQEIRVDYHVVCNSCQPTPPDELSWRHARFEVPPRAEAKSGTLSEREYVLLERLIEQQATANMIPWKAIARSMPGRTEKELYRAYHNQPEVRREVRRRYKGGSGKTLNCKSATDDGTCGTFGCKLPNKHAGLCQVVVDGPRHRRPKCATPPDHGLNV